MTGVRTVRVFVSSPSDVEPERQRIEFVAERLNGLHAGVVRFEVLRWETRLYTADRTFQQQIPEAAECDIVIGIFWARLGSELPPTFPRMPDGSPYPSGTAYELLSAIRRRQEKTEGDGAPEAATATHPDVYIFQKQTPPFPAPKDERELGLLLTQWNLLKGFIERWFLDREGHFLAAFNSFSTTDQFERQIEKVLLDWLAAHVLGASALAWPIATLGSPFRGLEAFDAWHAPVFFGRAGDIVRATDRLKASARGLQEGVISAGATHPASPGGPAGGGEDAVNKGCPFLLVLGASGAGKSSLLRAGVVPRLTTPGFVSEVDRWRVAVMRPSDEADPLDALTHALFARAAKSASEGRSPYDALPEIGEGDHAAPADLAALWRGGAPTTRPIERALDRIGESERLRGAFHRPVRVDLVLLIDQLDDLFASDVTDRARRKFAEVVSALVHTGRVWVLCSLRAALYEPFLVLDEFKTLKDSGVSYDLAPPSKAEIADIVRKPAAAAGLVFERDSNGVSLDERILQDADDPATLPLLQFTLHGLFEARAVVAGETRLTFAAYNAFGGVDGAIDRAAQIAFEKLEKQARDALPPLLRQLVVPVGNETASSGRQAMTIRSVTRTSAEAASGAKQLIEALIDARILTEEGDGTVPVIRVTHQRALESWQWARSIISANADFYRIRSEIEIQHQRWVTRGRKSEFLLAAGVPLAEAESIVARFGDELSPELRRFATLSGRRARLRQRATGAAAVVFACVALTAIYYWRQAQNGLTAATNAIAALVQGTSEVVRPLAQLDTVEQLVTQARAAINQFGGASRDDGIRKQHAKTYLLLADIDWDRGNIEQMRVDAIQGLDLLNQLVDNGDLENLLLRANSRRFLGITYFESNDRDRAKAHYDEGIADIDRLMTLHPNPDLEWRAQQSLANLYQELGDVLLLKFNQPQEALDKFDKCMALRQRILEEGHNGPAFVQDLAWAENKHGDVQVRLNDDAAALQWFNRARSGMEGLGDHLWDNLIWAYDLSLTYNNIGLIERRQERFAEAIEIFKQAQRIVQRVVDYDPKNLGRRSALSWTTFNIGEAQFRWARATRDSNLLQEAKAEFTQSTNDTGIDAAEAPEEARVQLGFARGSAYLQAIDATFKEWNGNHLGAAKAFAAAADLIAVNYLPHFEQFPRRDYVSEGIEYLDWAGEAYVAAGMAESGRPLLEKAIAMTETYHAILGDTLDATLRQRVRDDLAKLRGP